MTATRVLLIAFLVLHWPPLAAWAAAPAVYTPAEDSLCALRNGRFQVELVGESGCCPNRLSLYVLDQETGRERTLELETTVRKSGLMSLVGSDHLLIHALLERDGKALLLVDLAEGKLREEIWTYDFRLSPSGRRVVYTRHAGAGGAEAEQGTVLMLTDLLPPSGTEGAPASSHREIFSVAEAEAGKDEYPRRILSPLLWSEDESKVVFVERTASQPWLVSIDVSADAPRIRRRRIDPAKLVSPGSQQLSTGEDLNTVTLAWQTPSTLLLQAFLDDGLQEAVAFALP